jgi:hypothetical protein
LRELSHVASKEKAAGQGGMLKRPGDRALRSNRTDATGGPVRRFYRRVWDRRWCRISEGTVDPTDVIVIEIAYDRRRLELAMKAVVGAQELCALSKVTVQESKELLRQLDDTHAGSARVCAADCFTSSRSLARWPRSKSQPLQPSPT